MATYLTYFTAPVQCKCGQWNYDVPTMLADRPRVSRFCTRYGCHGIVHFDRWRIKLETEDITTSNALCPNCKTPMATDSRAEWEATHYRCPQYACDVNGIIPFPKYWERVQL